MIIADCGGDCSRVRWLLSAFNPINCTKCYEQTAWDKLKIWLAHIVVPRRYQRQIRHLLCGSCDLYCMSLHVPPLDMAFRTQRDELSVSCNTIKCKGPKKAYNEYVKPPAVWCRILRNTTDIGVKYRGASQDLAPGLELRLDYTIVGEGSK